MKSYLEKNNLLYFTFFKSSGKPTKQQSVTFLSTPTEDISNSLEDSGFNVINVRQMTATRTASNEHTRVEPFPLFLVTLTRKKSQELFKLKGLNHIIIKVDLSRAQTGLTQCYNCQNFGHV
jgi:hypothetical protein